jgi:FkbM family methyltransferase
VPTFITAKQPVVLDCGAFRGEFARWSAERFSARVISFEADPRLFESLPVIPGVTFHNFAISGADGRLPFHRSASRCSTAYFHNLSGSDADAFMAPARSLESFCDENAVEGIDLLKLDIEGSELDVFESATDGFLMGIKQITVEFHDFLDPGQVPRIKAVLQRMRNLGFLVVKMSFWTFGDVVMLNRRILPLTPLTAAIMEACRFRAGIRRMINRVTSCRSG